MKDYKYEYEEPTGDRYKVSIRKWNKVFANRGRWPFIYASVWVDKDIAVAHFYYTTLAKMYVTLLYPVLILYGGIKDANREVYRAWFQERTGSFSSDVIYKQRGDEFSKLGKIIGREL